MKLIFKTGDKKVYRKTVTEKDFATFEDQETLHAVCSTFSLARDMEWSSRLFFIEMKEPDEEGVGTFLSIDHKSPAFKGEELTFTATVEKVAGNELICDIEVKAADRLVASGKTGQKMLKKEKLREIFREKQD